MDAANLVENEKVQILNVYNGERFETYVITGKRGSGVICMNGPAARKVQLGDPIIIISYGVVDQHEAKSYTPIIIHPAPGNKLPL
jgi:aspartate 1-decarboxylase